MHASCYLPPSFSILSLSLSLLLILLLRLCSSPFSHCSSRFTLSVPFLSSFHSSRINAIIFRTFSFSFLCATLFCHESTHVRSFFYQCAVFTRVLLCPSFFLALSQPTLNRIVHSSLFLHPSESLQLSNASTFFSPAFVFYYYFRRSFSPPFQTLHPFPSELLQRTFKPKVSTVLLHPTVHLLSPLFFLLQRFHAVHSSFSFSLFKQLLLEFLERAQFSHQMESRSKCTFIFVNFGILRLEIVPFRHWPTWKRNFTEPNLTVTRGRFEHLVWPIGTRCFPSGGHERPGAEEIGGRSP